MPNKRKAERDRSPLHIWLQWGPPSHERTWCEDKINDDDVVYIRGGASVSDLALENLALTARVEKAEDIINEACALLKSPDMTNDGGCGLVDDIECLRHNYNAALDDLERVERDRDAANARIAAVMDVFAEAREMANADANRSASEWDNMSVGYVRDTRTSLRDRMDAALAGVEVLAVVDVSVPRYMLADRVDLSELIVGHVQQSGVVHGTVIVTRRKEG